MYFGTTRISHISAVINKITEKSMRKTTRARMIVPTAALMALVGVNVYTADAADAAEAERTSLVDKIIAQFNLNKDDVQKIVDEHRAQRQKEHRDRVNTALDDAVAAGKITAEQKQMILVKHDEMQKSRATTRTPGDRAANQQQRAQERQEMEQWAKDNGIDAQYVMMGGVGRGGNHSGAGKGGMQHGDGSCQQ